MPNKPNVERDVMEYDVVTVGAGPAGLVVRDPPEAAQPGAHGLRDREGQHHRRAHPVRRGDRTRSAGCAAARLARQPAADLRGGHGRRVLASQQDRRTQVPVCRRACTTRATSSSAWARCARGWRRRPRRWAWRSIPGFAAAETLHDDDGHGASACASATWAWPGMVRTSPATPPASTSTPRSRCSPKARAAT